ncbi:gliding motility-associated ABC transporter substrate-binding protein GldG [Psychroserpens ponticola]|uniref:Gliding motility-associated ABC transporter substrate-binding protein GldG n=1 Tax=Psychroserpens ponticola TaxID=2932268 RepID=A0ABY7S313_9FLAO|nr:gliding motility-associated ABC transporter substrate-binding protein GldG [Psychroserpens ponticola]WCO03380.1 gliding motility-associated ABC transporter substrate-binding protein GldG [Psychroserpens ponticola]
MIKNKKHIIIIGVTLVAIIVINLISSQVYKRFDLTQDKRYTLSEAAKKTIESVDAPIIVDVFLEGDFPSEFRRLRNETQQILEEFAVSNDNLKFNFINALDDESTRQQRIEQLAQRGMQPFQISVQENGKTSQEVVIPWALASYNEQTVIVPLIKNKIGATDQELVNGSIQNLEYVFAEAFKKLVTPKNKKIAILRGNTQLQDAYVADFLRKLGEHYFLAPFTLDSVASNPQKTLNDIKTYDLIISAKPMEPFTEAEKYVLDQYTMNGGKSLWLTEAVIMDQDSLYNNSGKAVAIMKDLNLNDFFFKYGVRVNPVMVNDLYSAPITLAIGEGSNAQFQPVQWPYSPLAANNPNHPITTNINPVRFDFSSQIDTLKNSVEKTILLRSSKLTRLVGVPSEVDLEIVTQEPDPKAYINPYQSLAVLLEGNFTSVYKNRVKPFQLDNDKVNSVSTKMIVIADGDVIKNEVIKNKPQELGFDRMTGRRFGNSEFLENAVNYLLNNDGLIQIRTKEVALQFLDPIKIEKEKSKWQIVNIALPLMILALFGFVFSYIRKRKYTS